MAHPQLHIVAPRHGIDLQVSMGDGPPTPTGGAAGWEQVARVERRAMTSFVGLPAKQQDVPILIDGFREGRSIERQQEELEALGGNVKFKATGPIYWSGSTFVFGDEPEFGDQIRDDDGTLQRLRMTLKLMVWVRPDIAGHKPAEKASVGQTAIPLTYITAKDDTLWKIAAKQYGLFEASERWKGLGKLNGITDPYRKLPAGRVINLS